MEKYKYTNTEIIAVMKEAIKKGNLNLFDYCLNLFIKNEPTINQLHIVGDLSKKIYGELDPAINNLIFR